MKSTSIDHTAEVTRTQGVAGETTTPGSMKGLVYDGPGKIEWRDVPRPILERGSTKPVEYRLQRANLK